MGAVFGDLDAVALGRRGVALDDDALALLLEVLGQLADPRLVGCELLAPPGDARLLGAQAPLGLLVRVLRRGGPGPAGFTLRGAPASVAERSARLRRGVLEDRREVHRGDALVVARAGRVPRGQGEQIVVELRDDPWRVMLLIHASALRRGLHEVARVAQLLAVHAADRAQIVAKRER